MPDVFLKDQKLKLIEYGSNQQDLEFVEDIKDKITSFLHDMIRK